MEENARVRRPRRTQEQMAQLVADYAESGLSRSAFCQKHQLASATLARYLRCGDAANSTQKASFVAVELDRAPGPRDSGVTLSLPNGPRVRIDRGFCTDTLRQVLSVLERG